MGYSCAAEAARTLEKFCHLPGDEGRMQNGWRHRGREYFYDIGRENWDGAITGSVLRVTGETTCDRVGSFRIEPNGTIRRAPYGMQERLVGHFLR